MMKKKQIKWCKWGLANSYDDRIEINEKLRNKPKLLKIILNHEKKHANTFDLRHEFDSRVWFSIPQLFGFIINNPKTWIDFLPIQKRNNQIVYDVNMIILYCLVLILSIVLTFIIKLAL
jgi:hypothetical protein